MNKKTDETATVLKANGENTKASCTLINEYTFDSFIVGDSNKFAHDLARTVADNYIEQNYNPLFIYGDSGLGKTHLLHAIRHAVEKNNPQHKVIYIRGNDFVDEFMSAVADDKIDKFRERYQRYKCVNYLLIDDIQHFVGKLATQDAFLNTYHALVRSGTQLVITSINSPIEINDFDNRLKTRFAQGVIAEIQPPEEDLQIKIIKQKAEQLGVTLPDAVTNYISASICTNIREMEGVVKAVVARSSILDEDITIDSVKAHLSYIELINKSKKENKIPDNISVNVEINIKKLCENTGFISLDEDDYKNVLDGAQKVYIGTGHAVGEGKSVRAARLAITNPIMAMPINEALKTLIIFTVSLDGDLNDVEEAAELIANAAHPDAAIIFGAFFDEEMEDEIRIDIIATR